MCGDWIGWMFYLFGKKKRENIVVCWWVFWMERKKCMFNVCGEIGKKEMRWMDLWVFFFSFLCVCVSMDIVLVYV